METQLNQRIRSTLEEIIEIFHETAQEKEAQQFSLILKKFEDSESKFSTLQNILSFYGGALSFNDLVISSADNFYPKENHKLDQLRQKLYEDCSEYIHLLDTRQISG